MCRLPVRTMGLLVGLSFASAADAAVLFVKPTPTGLGNSGSSIDAFALMDAINTAESGDGISLRGVVESAADAGL